MNINKGTKCGDRGRFWESKVWVNSAENDSKTLPDMIAGQKTDAYRLVNDFSLTADGLICKHFQGISSHVFVEPHSLKNIFFQSIQIFFDVLSETLREKLSLLSVEIRLFHRIWR